MSTGADEPNWPGTVQVCPPAGQAEAGWSMPTEPGDAGEGSVKDAAVAAYRASMDIGRPLSERKLAAMFGKTSRRWARNRMAEARHVSGPDEADSRMPPGSAALRR